MNFMLGARTSRPQRVGRREAFVSTIGLFPASRSLRTRRPRSQQHESRTHPPTQVVMTNARTHLLTQVVLTGAGPTVNAGGSERPRSYFTSAQALPSL